MAIWKRHSGSDSSPQQTTTDYGKDEYHQEYPEVTANPDYIEGQDINGHSTSLHRGLKARHITMIAIGGAIGTGLIIGTGSALARAG